MSAPIRKLTDADIDQINAQNARQFMALHPEFYGCPYNSRMLWDWAESQVGSDYPIQVETLEAGLDYLQDELQKRPAEEPQPVYRQPRISAPEKPMATRQEIAELKDMPLSALRVLANVQRHQLKGQPRPAAAQPGSESHQPDEGLNIRETAHATVRANYPYVPAYSRKYNALVGAEILKLKGAN